MRLNRIRWRIAIPYVLLIAVAMGVLSTSMLAFTRRTYIENLASQMASQAALLADGLYVAVDQSDMAEIQAGALRYAGLVNARVTVIALDGVVLADSADNPAAMDNHLYRPEVQAALMSGLGRSTRFSNTVNYEMMYVASTVEDAAGMVKGVVRVAVPLSRIDSDVATLRRGARATIWVSVILALALAVLLSERLVRPIRDLRGVVHRMTGGDLTAHLMPSTSDEVGELTVSFNAMADRMRQTIHSLGTERAQLAAVLENMADGVVITDGAGRVELINPAARRILSISEELGAGRTLAQMVRQHEIVSVWQACAEQRDEQVELVEVSRANLFLQVVVTPLKGEDPNARLMILQDLSHVRRLETIRHEFVSNISHELRTPLASLKALSETLRDGALEDPPAAVRFLGRVDHEVDTLIQMTEELLELSRIESGSVPMRLLPTEVRDFVLPSVERLRPQAERAQLQVAVNLPSHLPLVLGDVTRLRQVITNLLHNAIKFTPENGLVSVTASTTEDEVEVRVQDTGEGIPPDVLQRIFERFYKRDRSRSEAGTGLGLAIAKHVVQAHGGRIWAESVEGQGSTFHFTVLRADSPIR
jgi:two-component system phosphate regulon sensor histidine kinase PhoR